MMRYGLGSDLAIYAEEQKKRGHRTDARTVKRVIRAFHPYRVQVALVLAAILITTLLGLVNPILVSHIFDDAIQRGNVTLLLIYVALMAITPIIAGIISVGQSYLSNKVGQSVMRSFRNQLYQHLQSMPLSFFTETRTGEVQSRLSNDVGGVQGVITTTATNVVSNISTVLGIIIVMVFLSPPLTVIALSLLPLFLWVTYKIGKVRRQTSNETQKSLASLTALMQETLSVSGILLVKVFGRQKYAQAQFDQENQKLADLAVRQLMVGRWLFMIMGIFFGVAPALVYLVAGSQIINHAPVLGGSMTLGTTIAFVVLQTRLFFPVGELLGLQVEIQGALALFERIFEYLDMPIDIADKPNALQLKPEEVRGEIIFKNVAFGYKRNEYSALTDLSADENSDKGKAKRPGLLQERARPVLKNISFSVKPGQLVAIVGSSDAGKTTITYMLPRLYDVESGAVEIDGINVKDIAQASLAELIGVVTQETYLFHTSIRENILYARQDASMDEMIEAAKAAAIHERIMELEDGYDTIVGERGYKLSGGEKQRVAIARVILKNPRILILNEATSSLDTHSERLVQSALETLMKGRTTLAIAHRLSTILAADVILVVDKGKIVERGTHEELLALEGLYAQLYREQFSRSSGVENMETRKGQVPVRRDRARLLSDISLDSQTFATCERQWPYQHRQVQAGKDSEWLVLREGTNSRSYSGRLQPLQVPTVMRKKAASPIRQFRIPFTGPRPALPTTKLPSPVPVGKEFASFLPFTLNAETAALVKPRLIIISSYADEMHEIFLERDTITLGEADSNDIVLGGDPLISPYHALLRKKDGDYYLFDQYSQRGVFVNGQELTLGVGYKLANGDQITLGQYRLIFANLQQVA